MLETIVDFIIEHRKIIILISYVALFLSDIFLIRCQKYRKYRVPLAKPLTTSLMKYSIPCTYFTAVFLIDYSFDVLIYTANLSHLARLLGIIFVCATYIYSCVFFYKTGKIYLFSPSALAIFFKYLFVTPILAFFVPYLCIYLSFLGSNMTYTLSSYINSEFTFGAIISAIFLYPLLIYYATSRKIKKLWVLIDKKYGATKN